jgi:hypothetical protein
MDGERCAEAAVNTLNWRHNKIIKGWKQF